MKIQRFLAGNMQKGMAIVRKELGENAVLLSTKGVEGGIEIVATNEFDSDEMKNQMPDKPANDSSTKRNNADTSAITNKRFDPFNSKGSSSVYLQDMQEELARLRKLFEGELAQLTWRDSGDREPNRMALISRLDKAGFNRSLQGKIVDKILPCKDLEMAWRRVQRLLNRIIHVSEQEILQEGGIIVLVGSTGVGKTATAGKIASQFSKLHGKNNVGFINTDSKVIGGQGQLFSLGTSMGIPVQNVTNIEEIENTLESYSGKKLVIIDTGGLNRRDSTQLDNLKLLLNLDENIKPFLVLAATTQESLVYETIQSFSGIKIAGAIITKIDESSFVGPVLSGIIRKKIPITFFGNGQNIQEDLIPADAELLVQAVVDTYEESFRPSKTNDDANDMKNSNTVKSWSFVN